MSLGRNILVALQALDVPEKTRGHAGREALADAAAAAKFLRTKIVKEHQRAAEALRVARRSRIEGVYADDEPLLLQLPESALDPHNTERRLFFHLCDVGVVRTAILPGLMNHEDALDRLLPEFLKLLAAMTLPPVPDPATYARQSDCLHRLKRTIANDAFMQFFVAAVAPLAGKRMFEADGLTAENSVLVEVALTFISHLLKGSSRDIAESVVGCLCRSQTFELLLVILQQNHSTYEALAEEFYDENTKIHDGKGDADDEDDDTEEDLYNNYTQEQQHTMFDPDGDLSGNGSGSGRKSSSGKQPHPQLPPSVSSPRKDSLASAINKSLAASPQRPARHEHVSPGKTRHHGSSIKIQQFLSSSPSRKSKSHQLTTTTDGDDDGYEQGDDVVLPLPKLQSSPRATTEERIEALRSPRKSTPLKHLQQGSPRRGGDGHDERRGESGSKVRDLLLHSASKHNSANRSNSTQVPVAVEANPQDSSSSPSSAPCFLPPPLFADDADGAAAPVPARLFDQPSSFFNETQLVIVDERSQEHFQQRNNHPERAKDDEDDLLVIEVGDENRHSTSNSIAKPSESPQSQFFLGADGRDDEGGDLFSPPSTSKQRQPGGGEGSGSSSSKKGQRQLQQQHPPQLQDGSETRRSSTSFGDDFRHEFRTAAADDEGGGGGGDEDDDDDDDENSNLSNRRHARVELSKSTARDGSAHSSASSADVLLHQAAVDEVLKLLGQEQDKERKSTSKQQQQHQPIKVTFLPSQDNPQGFYSPQKNQNQQSSSSASSFASSFFESQSQTQRPRFHESNPLLNVGPTQQNGADSQSFGASYSVNDHDAKTTTMMMTMSTQIGEAVRKDPVAQEMLLVRHRARVSESMHTVKRWNLLILEIFSVAFQLAPAAAIASWSHPLLSGGATNNHNKAASEQMLARRLSDKSSNTAMLRAASSRNQGAIASSGLVVRKVVRAACDAASSPVPSAASTTTTLTTTSLIAVGSVSAVIGNKNADEGAQSVDKRKKSRFSKSLLLQPLVSIITMPLPTQKALAEQFRQFSEFGFGALSSMVWDSVEFCVNSIGEAVHTAAMEKGALTVMEVLDEIGRTSEESIARVSDVMNFFALSSVLLRFGRMALALLLEARQQRLYYQSQQQQQQQQYYAEQQQQQQQQHQESKDIFADIFPSDDYAPAQTNQTQKNVLITQSMEAEASAENVISMSIVTELVTLHRVRLGFKFLAILQTSRELRTEGFDPLRIAEFLAESIRVLVHALDGELMDSDAVKLAAASMAASLVFDPSNMQCVMLLLRSYTAKGKPPGFTLDPMLRLLHSMFLLLDRVSYNGIIHVPKQPWKGGPRAKKQTEVDQQEQQHERDDDRDDGDSDTDSSSGDDRKLNVVDDADASSRESSAARPSQRRSKSGSKSQEKNLEPEEAADGKEQHHQQEQQEHDDENEGGEVPFAQPAKTEPNDEDGLHHESSFSQFEHEPPATPKQNHNQQQSFRGTPAAFDEENNLPPPDRDEDAYYQQFYEEQQQQAAAGVERDVHIFDYIVQLTTTKNVQFFAAALENWRSLAEDSISAVCYFITRLMQPEALEQHKCLFHISVLLPIVDIVLNAKLLQPYLHSCASALLESFFNASTRAEIQLRVVRSLIPLDMNDVGMLEDQSEDPLVVEAKAVTRHMAVQQQSKAAQRERKRLGIKRVGGGGKGRNHDGQGDDDSDPEYVPEETDVEGDKAGLQKKQKKRRRAKRNANSEHEPQPGEDNNDMKVMDDALYHQDYDPSQAEGLLEAAVADERKREKDRTRKKKNSKRDKKKEDHHHKQHRRQRDDDFNLKGETLAGYPSTTTTSVSAAARKSGNQHGVADDILAAFDVGGNKRNRYQHQNQNQNQNNNSNNNNSNNINTTLSQNQDDDTALVAVVAQHHEEQGDDGTHQYRKRTSDERKKAKKDKKELKRLAKYLRSQEPGGSGGHNGNDDDVVVDDVDDDEAHDSQREQEQEQQSMILVDYDQDGRISTDASMMLLDE